MLGLAHFNRYLEAVQIEATANGEERLARVLATMRTAKTDQEVFALARALNDRGGEPTGNEIGAN